MAEKEEYEVVIVSSAGQFTEFLESTVWTDIKKELGVWLEGVRDGLEDVDADEKDLFRNQGRANAVKYLMSLPETMRDSLLEEQRSRDTEDQNTNEMEELING